MQRGTHGLLPDRDNLPTGDEEEKALLKAVEGRSGFELKRFGTRIP